MRMSFTTDNLHTVTEANINFYATPFIHPKRTMCEHDFIYILQGEWKFGQNDEVFEAKKDHLLILAAENLHFGLTPCTPATKTMYFHVSFENGDGFNPEGLFESLTDASQNPNIKRLFQHTVSAKLSGNQRKADLYFELLLCELINHNHYTADTELAVKLQNIIHSNPERFFSNTELAQMLNVSVKTAETKFKLRYGVSLHQYMLNFKTEEAITYFNMYPDISIKQVAHNLGFYDEYHFSKQFKKTTGLSPTEYRKQNL
jgi:AraC-like DNA-binding protein